MQSIILRRTVWVKIPTTITERLFRHQRKLFVLGREFHKVIIFIFYISQYLPKTLFFCCWFSFESNINIMTLMVVFMMLKLILTRTMMLRHLEISKIVFCIFWFSNRNNNICPQLFSWNVFISFHFDRNSADSMKSVRRLKWGNMICGEGVADREKRLWMTEWSYFVRNNGILICCIK